MTDIRLLVAGSRSIRDYDRVAHILSNASYIHDKQVISIIHGGAEGVDRLAGRWAAERGYPEIVVFPRWDLYGRSAGYHRNAMMVTACDAAIVIWDGSSKGTKHTIDLLHDSGKPYVLVVRP